MGGLSTIVKCTEISEVVLASVCGENHIVIPLASTHQTAHFTDKEAKVHEHKGPIAKLGAEPKPDLRPCDATLTTLLLVQNQFGQKGGKKAWKPLAT